MKRVFCSTLLVVAVISLFFAGCGSDEGSDYEGVGKLVSDRNSARLAKDADRKRSAGSGDSPSSAIKRRAQSSEMLVEEEVKVVGLSSGKVLARATAYLDDNGNIINIRIRKD